MNMIFLIFSIDLFYSVFYIKKRNQAFPGSLKLNIKLWSYQLRATLCSGRYTSVLLHPFVRQILIQDIPYVNQLLKPL